MEKRRNRVLLLAIRPRFAEAILEGRKTYEFRKRLPREDVDTVLLYASSPVKAVIGHAHIDDTLTLPLSQLWERTKRGAGIDNAYFHEYFGWMGEGSALALSSPVRLSRPVPLEELGVRRAPQSFMYVDASAVDRIRL